jgi:antitoxin MazE
MEALAASSLQIQLGGTMKTRVQKWGNSLALRIPKSFASEVGLKSDSTVEVSAEDGRPVITPVAKPQLTLKQLLAKQSTAKKSNICLRIP